MTTRWTLLLLLLLLGAGALLYSQRQNQEYVSEQFVMDTLIKIRVYGADRDRLREAVTDAFNEIHRIADLTDRFPEPGTFACNLSDICRLNAAAGVAAVKVDADTLAMLQRSRAFFEESGGVFDVTIGPVMDLWGFAGKDPRLPDAAALSKSLKLVDSRQIVIDEQERSAYLPVTGMKIDLGAIAKGYATEKALQILVKHGIKQALIDAGGNIRVLGRNREDKPWRIGIKDPRHEQAIIAVVEVEDGAVVTSGDYYRYFEVDGHRYNHIIDPRSGYPAEKNISATVVTRDAAEADLLSTALFVLPPEQSLQLAQQHGADLLLVSAEKRIEHTPDPHGRFRVQASPDYHYDQSR